MKITHKNIPFFHICLENIFSSEELEIIFKEINQLKYSFKHEYFTKSATDKDLKLLKKNTGVFLSETKNYQKLKITKLIDKCIKKISNNENWNNLTFKRMFNSLMWGGELLNCYKNNDYYKPHADVGIFTIIFFLWDDNSNFQGGNLFFPEYDYVYNCIHNNAIVFLSKEIHGVTPIKILNKNSNRYSIVTFSTQNHIPRKQKKYRDNIEFFTFNYT
jgi:predicted 2-oxoglutarate/Fe(II)-dependent dioxygenase YbiX